MGGSVGGKEAGKRTKTRPAIKAQLAGDGRKPRLFCVCIGRRAEATRFSRNFPLKSGPLAAKFASLRGGPPGSRAVQVKFLCSSAVERVAVNH